MEKQHVLRFIALVVTSAAVLSSCFLFRTGLDAPTAMTVQVAREAGFARSVQERAPGDVPVRVSPDNAKVAFTRIWYPSLETVEAILADTANVTRSDFTSIADPDSYAAGCLAVLDRDPDEPLVFDLQDSEFRLQSDVLPTADTIYPGVIIATLYYEFAVNDFTMRWYTMADSTYQRGDTLVKTGSEVTGGTGGEFRFAYVSNETGKVEFFEERQTLSYDATGYSSIIRDEMWADWDDGGDSGLLPAQTHYILHDPIDTVDENNSLFFESGNAPEVVEYVIRYNLSIEYGGMEYAPEADADGNGNLTFSDLITSTASRTLDLMPITGAIDYSY